MFSKDDNLHPCNIKTGLVNQGLQLKGTQCLGNLSFFQTHTALKSPKLLNLTLTKSP